MRRVLLVALAALSASACGSSGSAALPTVSPRGFPLGDLTIAHGGHSPMQFTVEIADNNAAWEKGLMGVKSLAKSQGMAFVFPRQQSVGFWMKDTLVPLDIAFADASGHVVDVQHMVPCTADPCQVYYAAQPYSLALETASGVLTGASVHAGDAMTLKRRAHPTASPSG